jgi:hypothetical protein
MSRAPKRVSAVDHLDPVEVDGLKIVGAYARAGHSLVALVEAAFLRQDEIFPEHFAPVHARWGVILEKLPEIRGRHLYEELSDVYRIVEAESLSQRTLVAYDLAILQHRFVVLLAQNRMLLPGGTAFYSCNARAWQFKLLDRIERQKPWRRNTYGKIKKPVTAEVRKIQPWYH